MILSLMLKLSSLKMKLIYGCLEEYLRLERKNHQSEETLSVVMMSSKFVDIQCSQIFSFVELLKMFIYLKEMKFLRQSFMKMEL